MLPPNHHIPAASAARRTLDRFRAVEQRYPAGGTNKSAANVEGCERCHGAPYLKHGYRAAEVVGLPDFAACKTCHYDTRTGSHEDWQYMVDDPAAWADGDPIPTPSPYAYKATVMNDTHMSHAMEFPYPTSMVTCAVCHEGKLDKVINDDTFTATTCKSCHPIQDQGEYQPKRTTGSAATSGYWDMNRAPAFELLFKEENVTWHIMADECSLCNNLSGMAFTDLKLERFRDYRITVLGILIAVSLFLEIFVHWYLGISVVYSHFFYIPVVLAAVWYGKRSVIVALILGSAHLAGTYYSAGAVDTGSIVRALMFFVIALVIGAISDHMRKEQEQMINDVTDAALRSGLKGGGTSGTTAERKGRILSFASVKKLSERRDVPAF